MLAGLMLSHQQRTDITTVHRKNSDSLRKKPVSDLT